MHARATDRRSASQMPRKMARSDPRPGVRVTRGAGSGQHLASGLQEGRENANIDTGLGFIWRISVYVDGISSSNPGCHVSVLANLDPHDCCGSSRRRVRRRLDRESYSPKAVSQFHWNGPEEITRRCHRGDIVKLVPGRLHCNDFSVGELYRLRQLAFHPLYPQRPRHWTANLAANWPVLSAWFARVQPDTPLYRYNHWLSCLPYCAASDLLGDSPHPR